MKLFTKLLSLALLGCLLLAYPVLSQDSPEIENRLAVLMKNRQGLQSSAPFSVIPYQFFGDLSVLDSNGI
jgi:hypothetical protein